MFPLQAEDAGEGELENRGTNICEKRSKEE